MGKWRRATTGLQRHPRVVTDVPIRVSTVDPERDPDSGELFFRSSEETTANLSRSGAFVRSWEPLAAGRRVIVEIDLPEAEMNSVQLVGRVVWTRRRLRAGPRGWADEPGYGIEFAAESQRERAALDRYLAGLEIRRATEPLHTVARGPWPQP